MKRIRKKLTAPPARVSAVMTVEEVARYLRLSIATIWKLARAGEMPAFKLARRWRFHKWALDQWAFEKCAKEPGRDVTESWK